MYLVSKDFYIFDVSNPIKPNLVLQYVPEEYVYCNGFSVTGSEVFLATTHGLIALDISNPQDSREIGKYWDKDYYYLNSMRKNGYLMLGSEIPNAENNWKDTGIEVLKIIDSSKQQAQSFIQKADELINQIKALGYQIKFADSKLNKAKEYFSKGDYQAAKNYALDAWITAFREWRIQWEADILKRSGVDVGEIFSRYNSGDLEGAITLIKEASISGEYSELLNSIDQSFETVENYWKEGIRLWNYLDKLFEANRNYLKEDVGETKTMAENALKVLKDIGDFARDLLEKINSLEEKGLYDREVTEAKDLFERGEFEEANMVIEGLGGAKLGDGTANVILILIAAGAGLYMVKRW